MRPFDTFDAFYLPNRSSSRALPAKLVRQINLFSRYIFLRDYRAYRDLCKVLGLYFDLLDSPASSTASSTAHDVIDSTYFVVDRDTRRRLKMNIDGFQESPVPFLKKLLVLRRHGQPLGPSHMGQLLHGLKLSKEDDF
jgi:hypothetical protein